MAFAENRIVSTLAAMFRNYLLVALRHLRKQKGFAAINVFGLAIGLACSFFVLLWVRHELSYDRFHTNADRLYRVLIHLDSETGSSTPKPLTDVLETSFSEVEHAVLTTSPMTRILARGQTRVREVIPYVGGAFFEAFSFPLLAGDPATVLDAPSSIVLSASAARRLFGDAWRERGIIGEPLEVEGAGDVVVSGVFADVPDASSIQAGAVMPAARYIAENPWVERWGNRVFGMYVLLRDPGARSSFEAHASSVLQAQWNAGARVSLQPIADQHLYSEFRDGQPSGGRIVYVRLFVLIAGFLLLIAAINFMNLATARSARRAREIGVRKAIGAVRGAVASQFLVEALLLAALAFGVAVALVAALLPAFRSLTHLHVSLATLDLRFWLAGVGVTLGVGLVAGSYPALYLASFRPVTVLKGPFRPGRGPARLRKGLVVFQFALSTLLLVGTITVAAQMDYIRTKPLGLDRANVVSTRLEATTAARFDAYREDLLMQSSIEAVTASDTSPLEVGSYTNDPVWDGKPADASPAFYVIHTTYDFAETMRMTLVAGRSFSRDFPDDDANFVINQQAAAAMGMADPVGQRLAFWGREGEIVGVVEDFHMGSLYSVIEPTILLLDPANTSQVYVRTAPGQTQEALAALEDVTAQFNPGYPFDYTFLDAEYERTYRAEALTGTLTRVFAGVALFIAILGLLGLVAFAAEQRRKEIGVRKALGATVPSLLRLLMRDYVVLVGAAFALAAPLAWWGAQRWLEGFAYHTALGPGILFLAGGLLLATALVTVGVQAFRAAKTGPVRALRYE